MKFVDINKYLIGKFMYKCYRKFVPEFFLDLFTPIREVHYHETRQSNQLYCPSVSTNLGKTKLTYRGPLIWNKIIQNRINPNTSERVFSKSVQDKIIEGKI